MTYVAEFFSGALIFIWATKMWRIITFWAISTWCFSNWLYIFSAQVQSNLVIRNYFVTLKLFLNAKCSLSLWSKLAIGHGKWFLNTNLFLINTFLTAKFDCTIKVGLVFSISNFFINRIALANIWMSFSCSNLVLVLLME